MADCPNCEYHRQRAQLWREEAYKQAGHPLPEREQEPVAFINVEQRKLEWAKYMSWDTPTVVNLPKIPLYTTPPQPIWVGLTDEEMLECLKAVDVCTAVNLLMGQYEMPPTFKVYAEAIQSKLKEKNT
jgi:hypothetical protein